MTISRQKLYAMGEPFGADCTRREGGRTIYGGGGDSSSESSSQQSTTTTDSRVLTGPGSIGLGQGASINGTAIVNDPTAQIHAMDLASSSTQAALAANLLTTEAANKMVSDATAQAMAAAQASADAAAAAAAQSAAASSQTASEAMQGTWKAQSNISSALINGMNTVLSSSQNVMDMEQAAFKQVGAQIQTAYQAASDISTGNRQLVTVGMIALGLMSLFVLKGGKALA